MLKNTDRKNPYDCHHKDFKYDDVPARVISFELHCVTKYMLLLVGIQGKNFSRKGGVL